MSKITGLLTTFSNSLVQLWMTDWKRSREIFSPNEAVPIDADPRVAALFAARETANGALEIAKFGLEGVKQSVGAMAEVGQYIVDFGLGGLLDIREASFEGSLTATNGGHVTLAMTLSFMGDPHTLTLPFSFHDP